LQLALATHNGFAMCIKISKKREGCLKSHQDSGLAEVNNKCEENKSFPAAGRRQQ